MKKLPEILQDSELSKEFYKAYAIASRYKTQVQYRLRLINESEISDARILHPIHGVLLSIHSYTFDKRIFISNTLKGE